MKILVKFIFIYVCLTELLIASESPNSNDIKKWIYNYDNNVNIENYSEFKIIHRFLIGNEEYFLATSYYEDHRGVKECCELILIRPHLKKAKLIGSYISSKVIKVDKLGFFFVELDKFFHGTGGFMKGIKTINYIKDWELVELMEQKYYNNYMPNDSRYRSVNVDYEYNDYNNDRALDLIIRKYYRSKNKRIIIEDKYLFKNNRFEKILSICGYKKKLIESVYVNNDGRIVYIDKNSDIKILKTKFEKQTLFSKIKILKSKNKSTFVYFKTYDNDWVVDYFWDLDNNKLNFRAESFFSDKINKSEKFYNIIKLFGNGPY